MNWKSFCIATVAAFLTVASALSGNAVEAATLPIPCAGGTCAPAFKTPGMTAPPAGFVTSGAAIAVQSGNTLTVNQTTDQAILNWQSFNISADGRVIFNQPSATSIALNKIYQSSPSAIFGQLTANGQVYLINPNGFVFGSSASVNVAGLVASSLGMTGDLSAGILAPGAQKPPAPAFASDGRTYITDSSGNPILDATGKPQPVQITVQPGAQMTAASTASGGGRILLAGQNVTNGGSIAAPDGQVVLAAGQSLYLAGSSDPSMRGLIVEVSGNNPCNSGDPCTGTVTNQAGATLSSPRGNVSLVGLAVNQNGRISATTAVSANGSVILRAGNDTLGGGGDTGCKTGETICANTGGTLELGSTSEIDVLPELADTTTAVVGQKQIQSTIELTGQQVDIAGQITAPGGTVNVMAAANPDLGLATNGNGTAQIRVAAGTNIDLHGSDAVVPMSSNLLSIQLRSNELEDDPLQRGGPLQAQTVIVDVRNGKPAIISEGSWQSALQAIPQTIAQRTSVGGTINFQSEGDVVVNKGSTINVSGGKWTYASGVSQTSQLIGTNGKLYDISTANPSILYKGVLNPTYTVNYNGFGVQITNPTPGLGRVSPGYIQGFSAGTVSFAAPAMSLQGSLVGSAVNGIYQRDPTRIPAESLMGYLAKNVTGGNGLAMGGTLIIGDATPLPSGNYPDFFSPGVVFTNNISPIVVADGAPLPTHLLELSPSYITDGGFSTTQIFSNSTVTLPAGMPLNLGIGGSLQVEAARISIGSDIQALGGSISLLSAATATSQLPGNSRIGIDIASGVTLDVRGQWTNDSPLLGLPGQAPLYQNGGSISLSLAPGNSPTTSGGELVIGDNVSFRASGGAWLQANNSLAGGTGGSITIDASPYQSALQIGNNISLDAFGVQGATGGSFSLSAPRISVSQGSSWATAKRIDDLPLPADPNDPTAVARAPGGVFDVGSGLFSNYGFSNISLTATAPLAADADGKNVLTITSGTAIDARAQSLMVAPGYLTRRSGGVVTDFSQAQLLPTYNRKPMTLAFAVAPGLGIPATIDIGDLEFAAGASLNADPLSKISFTGQGSLYIDGIVRAAGGSILARIDAPNTVTDPGYLPDQRLELGSQSVLDVSGTTLLKPNTQNLRVGTVLAGGTVSLVANRGDIEANAGSEMDAAGASDTLDVNLIGGTGGYRRTVIGSAGGSILARSVESISLLGTMQAAGGASSLGTLAGGSLEVDLSPLAFVPGTGGITTPLPTAPPTIELVSGSLGTTPSASYGNYARLGVTQLAASGIDFLTLKSDNTIALDNSTPLTLRGSINLDTPNLSVGYGVTAALNAPYVSITDTNTKVTAAAPALGGSGVLNVNAQEIALSGFVSLQGVSSATFTSSGDVQFQAVDGSRLAGTLALAGDLAINAERIFPATQTSYTISDSAADGHVVFGSTLPAGQSPDSLATPFSVAGSLTVNAANISSSGTIMAPFGVVSFNATDSLSLLDGSLTSVSADGATLLYGKTVLGQSQWIYAAGNNTLPVNGVPTRAVNLNAPNVSFAKNASIDVSGGGDLSAYEWIPGTGGSVDSLGQANAASAGLYAVLPSMMGQYAAYDIQEFAGSNVKPGSSIYLSGTQGLAAGTYALLPARYALLPGAFLIQIEPGFQSLVPGTIGTLTDGSAVTAGYLTFGNTGLQTSSGYIGVSIRAGSYAQQLARYQMSNGTDFFSAAAAAAADGTDNPPRVTLPADAGALLFAATNSLKALGKVNSAAGKNGSAATIEISSSDLTVTASDDQVASTGVSISAPVINSWAAGDLILGGQLSADGKSLAVTANNLTIGTGAQFSAGRVIAVADQSIEVQSGATVASTSGVSGTAPKTLPKDTPLTLKTADGSAIDSGAALLAVSDTSLPIAVRVAEGGTVSPVTSGATVTVDAGATLSSRGAVALDAPQSVVVNGTLNGPGASWSLASNSIGFVGDNSTSTETFQINSGLLAQMQTAGALRLASADAINLDTAVTLNPSTLGSLHLIGNSVNNVAGGNSIFGAQTVTLEGLSTTTAAAPAGGTGALTFAANILNVGPGNLAISGNNQTTLQASTAMVGRGTGALAVGGNSTLSTPVVTAESRAETTIGVPDGTLTVLQSGTAPDISTLAGSLGGHLALTANQIQDTGSIITPGGTVSLTATPGVGGTQAASSINLGSGALIDTRGINVGVADQVRGAAGGIVNLAATGAVTLASGSTVNVSGAGKAPGGFLSVTGGGTVTLDGTLAGNAASGVSGGNFRLSAGQLAGGLTPLAGKLTSGGFNNLVNVRVQSGDLNVASGTTLTANQINLTADTGSIDVAGTLNAPSAGQRGSIGLFAGTGLTLEATGALLANGAGADGRGGEIELSTVGGVINLNSGSVIAGSGQAQMGTLLLRAPAIVNTGDVGIGTFAANTSGVGTIVVEPVLPTYQNTGDFTSNFGQIQTDIANYLVLANTTLPGRLPAGAVIQPGVVIQQDGDLTLSSALDLYSLNLGAPIDLTVRAGGNVTVSGSISDGIASDNTLSTSLSSSLRFVAGADLTSANPLATRAGGSGDLWLTNNSLVRTGTGDIDLVAALNVTVDSHSSAYTFGINGSDPAQVTLSGSKKPFVNFLTGGGNLVVDAGNDVKGADQMGPLSPSDWQLRGSKGSQGTYGVNFDAYNQNPWTVASFGGGDVRISAGEDVLNVAAANSDSLALAGTTQTHFNSGSLTVNAGRDITTGQFFVADSIGTLTAGRSFASNLTGGDNKPVGSVFELSTAAVSLWAQDGILVSGVLNPTILQMPAAAKQTASFYTYGASSAFNAQSSAGDISITDSSPDPLELLLGTSAINRGLNSFAMNPASLGVSALTGDLSVEAILFPANTGSLRLFAGRDVLGPDNSITFMSDAPDVAIPTAANIGTQAMIADLLNTAPNGLYGASSNRHMNDPDPAVVVAGRDILNFQLSVPKASDIEAGRDIVGLFYHGQNLHPDDITLMSAGRDFKDPPQLVAATGLIDTNVNSLIALGGQGSLDILAGRNIDLGFSQGVTTVGALANPNLGRLAHGADINMLAGLGQRPDYTSFVTKIVEPSTSYVQELVTYVEGLTQQINLSVADAETQFAQLSADLQRPLIQKVFFEALNASGIEAKKPGGPGYKNGYAAIDALFPGSRNVAPGSSGDPYAGDLSLDYSQIYTIAGGNIALLIPGGSLNVGLASPPSGGQLKAPSQLGIVAQGYGDVSIYSKSDVNVNSSRIFTLGGGNILVWSNEGDIDAGNGAKTSLSLPPPTFTVDSSGNQVLVFNAAVAGSGIRTISTGEDQPLGDVNLIAPIGAVDAGDAGIGAAGNINIAAATVIGASNINFGGTATGVPPAVSSIAASVPVGAAATTASSTSAASLENMTKDQAAPLAASALSWLDVFVTGLGEEDCKPSDEECIKRQKK